jgi:hypothetical protein
VREKPGECVRCGYSQLEDLAKRRARGLAGGPSKVMLLVDRHVQHEGRWGAWRGGKFIRGGRSEGELYWVCEHCHAPGEAIQVVEKGYGLNAFEDPEAS